MKSHPLWSLPLALLPALLTIGGCNAAPDDEGRAADGSQDATGSNTKTGSGCRVEVLGGDRAGLEEFRRTTENDAALQHNSGLGDILEGAANFFLPFPGGNGRACATCHIPSEGFSISPKTVEARWLKLQERKKTNPCADDPLFRSIDADDFQQNFATLRKLAVFRVHVPLPQRVRLVADPEATEVAFFRAAPPLNLLKHTAPYQQDRAAKTLEEQALGAINAHFEPTVQPNQRFLDTVAAFQRVIFSSFKVKQLSDAIDSGGAIPNTDPPLNATEQLGRQKFDNFCRNCHGGPAMVQNFENRIFPPFDGSTNPVSVNVIVSNPPADGFPNGSPLQTAERNMPTQFFDVDLPDGTSVVLESSDPGTVLTDVAALETVGGNRVFNRFDIPTLHGINNTAPFFHDHRAKNLEEVVLHYQKFFFLINVVRGFPLPLIPDADVAPIVAYTKKAF
jgi:cytochrome c peroxidase